MALWKRLADNVAKFHTKFQNDVIILSKKVNLITRVRQLFYKETFFRTATVDNKMRSQGISFSVAILGWSISGWVHAAVLLPVVCSS